MIDISHICCLYVGTLTGLTMTLLGRNEDNNGSFHPCVHVVMDNE